MKRINYLKTVLLAGFVLGILSQTTKAQGLPATSAEPTTNNSTPKENKPSDNKQPATNSGRSDSSPAPQQTEIFIEVGGKEEPKKETEIPQPKPKPKVEEQVSISDWIEQFPIDNSKVILLKNNSKTRMVIITGFEIFECANVMVGICGFTSGPWIIRPGEIFPLKVIPPSDSKKLYAFQYQYWAEFAK